MQKYKLSNNGVTVTIFVPYDCNNKCPFCINKKEYEDTTGFSVKSIIESFEKLHRIMPECNVVFTGGEPMANLLDLRKLLDAIPDSHKIFINTTLPLREYVTTEDLADFLNYYKHKITCVNVSRHLKKYVKECGDEIFSMLEMPYRINCVMYEKFYGEDILNYIKRFWNLNTYIQFRRDYVYTTPENLYDEEDDYILRTLKDTLCYGGMFHKDTFRCGYEFFLNKYRVTYHKTLPYSTVNVDGYDVLTDIIIRQNGTINSDWNDYGQEIKLDDYQLIIDGQSAFLVEVV